MTGNNLSALVSLVITRAMAALTGNGTNVDFTGVNRGEFGGVHHFVAMGASGDSLSGALKVDYKIQHSDDDVTYTDVTDANHVSGQTLGANGIIKTVDDAAEDQTGFFVDYIGPKPYSRIRAALTGNHANGFQCHAHAYKFNPRTIPAS